MFLTVFTNMSVLQMFIILFVLVLPTLSKENISLENDSFLPFENLFFVANTQILFILVLPTLSKENNSFLSLLKFIFCSKYANIISFSFSYFLSEKYDIFSFFFFFIYSICKWAHYLIKEINLISWINPKYYYASTSQFNYKIVGDIYIYIYIYIYMYYNCWLIIIKVVITYSILFYEWNNVYNIQHTP